MPSKSKLQTQPIEDFVSRIRVSKNKQDKQIVLSMKDAEKIADSLGQVMIRLASIQEEIIEAYKSVQESQTVNIEMDGGNFSKK
jgi:hypothetical protein